jgi:hypothetical protein
MVRVDGAWKPAEAVRGPRGPIWPNATSIQGFLPELGRFQGAGGAGARGRSKLCLLPRNVLRTLRKSTLQDFESVVTNPSHKDAATTSASLVEVRALSFSKECQSLWLYMPINNHPRSC